MTAKELIALLQQHDPDKQVFWADHGDGCRFTVEHVVEVTGGQFYDDSQTELYNAKETEKGKGEFISLQ